MRAGRQQATARKVWCPDIFPGLHDGRACGLAACAVLSVRTVHALHRINPRKYPAPSVRYLNFNVNCRNPETVLRHGCVIGGNGPTRL